MYNFEIRYVFDVGSSNTKSMCCLVDQNKGKILAILDYVSVALPYQSYINTSEDQKLDDEVMDMGIQSFQKILEYYQIDPINNPNIKCAGVATAWSRNALNSSEYLDMIEQQVGIQIKSISQYEEGSLSLKALLANPLCGMPAEKDISVLDVGGASFQLSYFDEQGQIQVYNGEYGASNFRKMFYDTMDQNQLSDYIANLSTDRDAMDLIGLSSTSLTTYGVGNFLNKAIYPIFQYDEIDYQHLSINDVIDSLQHYDHSAEEESNLLLLHYIMDTLHLDEISFAGHVSNLDAIAVYDDLWYENGFSIEDAAYGMAY